MAVMGRESATGHWLHWGHAWAHPSVMERRKAEAPRLRDFSADGDLTIVERIGDDVQEVADLVLRVEESGRMDKIGVDAVGIGAIVDALVERGIEADRIVAISQGWKMAGSIKTAERSWPRNPVPRWRAADGLGHRQRQGRAQGQRDAITKQAAGAAKIDPLMAMFNAVALLCMNPAAVGLSFWEVTEA